MHHHKDFVKATTTSEGTGDIELGSSPSGFKSFAVFSNGQKMDVLVVDNSSDPTNWEVFEATYNTGTPDTLTRGTLRSSNTGSRVNFPAGTKTVVAAPSAVLFSIASQTLDSNLRTAGSAGAYTVTTAAGLTPYDGYSVTVEANHDSPAGGCTLNPDGTGAVAIKLNDGSDPHAGAMLSDGKYDLQSDGTVLRLKNPSWIGVDPLILHAGASPGPFVISTTELVVSTLNLSIPSHWNTYDVFLEAHGAIYESGTSTSDTNFTVYARKTDVSGAIFGSIPPKLGTASPSDRTLFSLLGALYGETTTGSRDYCMTIVADSNSGHYTLSSTIIVARAYRRT